MIRNLGQKKESVQAAAIPKEAKAALKTMRGAPLPREKLANKVLRRILPAEPSGSRNSIITAIHGCHYTGKTTVTAMLVQIPSVRECYHHGIMWLRVPSTEELSYSGYVISGSVEMYCIEWGMNSRILQETVHVPGESGCERRAPELEAMARAKNMISYLQGKRVSMVLDGVGGMDDMSCLVLRSDHSPWP
jgi:hypothetical protein